jgi:hypothetical protein
MPEPDTATIWVTRDGTILSAGPVFTDWFAFTAKASMVARVASNAHLIPYLAALLRWSVESNEVASKYTILWTGQPSSTGDILYYLANMAAGG